MKNLRILSRHFCYARDVGLNTLSNKHLGKIKYSFSVHLNLNWQSEWFATLNLIVKLIKPNNLATNRKTGNYSKPGWIGQRKNGAWVWLRWIGLPKVFNKWKVYLKIQILDDFVNEIHLAQNSGY